MHGDRRTYEEDSYRSHCDSRNVCRSCAQCVGASRRVHPAAGLAVHQSRRFCVSDADRAAVHTDRVHPAACLAVCQPRHLCVSDADRAAGHSAYTSRPNAPGDRVYPAACSVLRQPRHLCVPYADRAAVAGNGLHAASGSAVCQPRELCVSNRRGARTPSERVRRAPDVEVPRLTADNVRAGTLN